MQLDADVEAGGPDPDQPFFRPQVMQTEPLVPRTGPGSNRQQQQQQPSQPSQQPPKSEQQAQPSGPMQTQMNPPLSEIEEEEGSDAKGREGLGIRQDVGGEGEEEGSTAGAGKEGGDGKHDVAARVAEAAVSAEREE